VLLAVLAAAGLLALAPALTRRYDGTERVEAERATSTARVLSRRRRRRTVPGPRPINPPRYAPRPRPGPAAVLQPAPTARPRRVGRRRPTALHRRRRVFLALVLLNLIELAGVVLVGPGFWIGFSVSFLVLLADLVYLRQRAVVASRIRRARLRHARWIAAEQAAVRREHDRRAALRAAALRRSAQERDEARRAARRHSTEYVERYAPRTS
jgi:predicted small integral membrane protein